MQKPCFTVNGYKISYKTQRRLSQEMNRCLVNILCEWKLKKMKINRRRNWSLVNITFCSSFSIYNPKHDCPYDCKNKLMTSSYDVLFLIYTVLYKMNHFLRGVHFMFRSEIFFFLSIFSHLAGAVFLLTILCY